MKRHPILPIIIAACVLSFATAALYWPITSYGFITLDDNEYIYENPNVINGLTWHGFRAAWVRNVVGHWHPLTMISHMLDVELFGMHAGMHLAVNLALHMLNVLLLYWLAVRCRAGALAAFLLAAVFAVHPLNVEGVAWVSQRKSLLSALSFFATLHAYLSYVRAHTWRWYVTAVLAYTLGLLSKPMLVSLPLILFILDWWPLRRWPTDFVMWQPRTWWDAPRTRRWILEKAPFIVLAAASCVITFMYQWRSGAISTLSQLGLALRLQNVVMAYCFYLWRLTWPFNLGIGYPVPLSHNPYTVLLWCFILSALTTVAYLLRRRIPAVWAGWLWYVVMLLPVSSLVQAGYAVVCDRFGYLPLIGIVVALVAVFARLPLRTTLRYAVQPTALLILALLALRTRDQLRYWQNSIFLYEHTLKVCGSSPLIHYNLGVAYMRARRYEDAIKQYRAALELQPNYYAALNNLGNVLAALERYEEAAGFFRAAAAADPRKAAPWNNLATLRSHLGQEIEALNLYNEALARQPCSPAVNYNLGNTYSALQRYHEAIRHYEIALGNCPTPFPVHINLGLALLRVGQTQQAEYHANRALSLSPDAPPALWLQALCHLQNNRPHDAIPLLHRALEHNDRYAEAHLALGTALRRLGDTNTALAHLYRAVALQPGNAEAQNNLGVALSSLGRHHEALTNLEIAVQVAPWFLEAYLNLGLCLAYVADYTNALALVRAAHSMAPSNSTVLGALAWLHAIATDPNVRDPLSALSLAQQAVKFSQETDPSLLDTLAICYAINNDILNARAAANKAIQLFLSRGNTNEALATQMRLLEYASHEKTAPH